VSEDELLGIGAFALLSGLTIATLRHHEIGLFKPASVDPLRGIATTGRSRFWMLSSRVRCVRSTFR
jgi:hypothetical protein